MTISIADLEKMAQNYPIESAVQLAIRDVPEISVQNPDITYLSMQLNGENPIDNVILQGLLPYKENGKSVSGLMRMLLYHYFIHKVAEG